MGNLRDSKTNEEWDELEERAAKSKKKDNVRVVYAEVMEAILRKAIKKYANEMTNPFCMEWYKEAKDVIAKIDAA